MLSADREEHDRIRNIVVLGINTFGWTLKVRGEKSPEPMPFVSLVSPSGEVWIYGESQQRNFTQGDAVEFAQVVTQTRNIADTSLTVVGHSASDWMSNAQCFAGGSNLTPEKGFRFKAG